MTYSRTIALALFVSLVFCSGCRYDSTGRERADKAKEFKSDLVAAISAAPQIEIVEHSWRDDFQDVSGEPLEDPPHIEYKRINLTPAQRHDLRERFLNMADVPKAAFASCIFEPHHSIELIAENGAKSVIFVCFTCDDTEWNGSDGIAPKEFQSVFRRFMEPLGFQASREWHELATNQLQQEAAGQPATRSRSELRP